MFEQPNTMWCDVPEKISLKIIEIISERQNLLIPLLKGHHLDSPSTLIPTWTQRPSSGERSGVTWGHHALLTVDT